MEGFDENEAHRAAMAIHLEREYPEFKIEHMDEVLTLESYEALLSSTGETRH